LRLKEFDLDLPQSEGHRREFREQTRCVTALYERCFPGLTVTGAWKVLVECVEKIDRREVLDELGVFEIQVPFTWSAWARAGVLERKKMALAKLHEGVLRITKAKKWPKTPFEKARRAVVERNYVNECTWPDRAVPSPDRRHEAILFCSHEMQAFRAWIVVSDRKTGKEVTRAFAFTSAPDEFAFVRKMGKLAWKSSRKVVLLARKRGRKREQVKAVTLR
jgi:hypothetical protein